jgi:hypothetical protein
MENQTSFVPWFWIDKNRCDYIEFDIKTSIIFERKYQDYLKTKQNPM